MKAPSKLDQLREMREAHFHGVAPKRVTKLPTTVTVTRVTPVTAVTSGAKAVKQARAWAAAMAEGTHCPTCGYRLPAKSKAAAKQAAYRARRKGNA